MPLSPSLSNMPMSRAASFLLLPVRFKSMPDFSITARNSGSVIAASISLVSTTVSPSFLFRARKIAILTHALSTTLLCWSLCPRGKVDTGRSWISCPDAGPATPTSAKACLFGSAAADSDGASPTVMPNFLPPDLSSVATFAMASTFSAACRHSGWCSMVTFTVCSFDRVAISVVSLVSSAGTCRVLISAFSSPFGRSSIAISIGRSGGVGA